MERAWHPIAPEKGQGTRTIFCQRASGADLLVDKTFLCGHPRFFFRWSQTKGKHEQAKFQVNTATVRGELFVSDSHKWFVCDSHSERQIWVVCTSIFLSKISWLQNPWVFVSSLFSDSGEVCLEWHWVTEAYISKNIFFPWTTTLRFRVSYSSSCEQQRKCSEGLNRNSIAAFWSQFISFQHLPLDSSGFKVESSCHGKFLELPSISYTFRTKRNIKLNCFPTCHILHCIKN